MQSVGQLPEVLDRRLDLRLRLVHLGVVFSGRGPQQAQAQQQADEALLGAVVEVALEPAPLAVSRLDDAHPRVGESAQLGQSLGAQPLVLEAQPGCRDDLTNRILVVEQAGAVHQDRDLLAALDEPARRTSGPGRHVHHREIDVAIGAVDEIRHLQRRVVQPLGQRLAHAAGRCLPVQVDDEAGDAAPHGSRSQQAEPDRDGQCRQTRELHPPQALVRRRTAHEATLEAQDELRGHGHQVEDTDRPHRATRPARRRTHPSQAQKQDQHGDRGPRESDRHRGSRRAPWTAPGRRARAPGWSDSPSSPEPAGRRTARAGAPGHRRTREPPPRAGSGLRARSTRPDGNASTAQVAATGTAVARSRPTENTAAESDPAAVAPGMSHSVTSNRTATRTSSQP